ncbi:YHYH protein [Candidatus Acetothermia bacterium]|nr:YHYH protein [Candidatus Acetothermia bacterium]MBI3460095.1 YHYH protein [Candidatus Acetothermia bacterium]
MSTLKFSVAGRLGVLTVFVLGAGLLMVNGAQSDPPELASWLINKTGATGYGGQIANVQTVQYSDNNVYVSSTGIPSYSIGPWPGQPNTPTVQNYIFRVLRKPTENTGTKVSTPIGPMGVLTNGVPVYDAQDMQSYNNQNIWHQNALVVEAPGIDKCNGHPQQLGGYHHHANPKCAYTDDPNQHSPLLGYSFDGYPIYGPRGCANADGTGDVKLMKSSYRLRNITQRTTLPNGTSLNNNQAGPDVSTRYPLGYYLEDYEYIAKLGDLDAHNGRFAVTPEYPHGTYAYFVTIDEKGTPQYPYIIGPQYFGTVATDNFGRGHVNINESVKTYQGGTLTSTKKDCK